MLKSFVYRLYPSKDQEELINKHIGCVRFIYNLALETKLTAYKTSEGKINLSKYDLSGQLTSLKKDVPWLKEVNSQSLQASIGNLDDAFKRFYTKQNSFPKFKSKSRCNKSFRVPQNVIVKDNKLIIPKFKEGIKMKIDRNAKGELRQATISRTPTGKYFVSILCKTGEKKIPKKFINKNTTIGIDLGLTDFLISSNNEKVDNPRYLRTIETKLKYTQRRYSKYKGKKNKYKLQKIHEKIKNQRKDFLHKVSSKLIRENQSIAIEDLNVKGMLKNHCLAKSISDVGWSMFIDMLKYKSEWYGVNLIQIGRFEPSSKKCSCCNYIKEDLTLKDRYWTCISCGTYHDRDFNASINIKNLGLDKYLNQVQFKYVSGTDTKTQNELSTLVEVMTSETRLISYAVSG